METIEACLTVDRITSEQVRVARITVTTFSRRPQGGEVAFGVVDKP